jgi:thiol:disulfide interchange protein
MHLTLLLVASLAAPAEGVQFVDSSWDETLELAAKSKKMVFVDFYADW